MLHALPTTERVTWRQALPRFLATLDSQRTRPTAERRIRAVLASDPGLSVRTLAKRARVSESTASKYRRLWDAERGQQLAQ